MRLLLSLVCSLFVFSACPEEVVEPDIDGGAGGGSGGGGGSSAVGEVRIQHKRGPGFVNLQADTEQKLNPAYFDGGAVFTTPAWFTTTQVTDSLSNSAGSVSGTYDGQRVDGGVVLSFTASATRGAMALVTMATSFDDLDLCITGTTGSARLDVACEGTLATTGAGLAFVLVGDGTDDGKFCRVALGGAAAQGSLPASGSVTAALVQGQRCFTVTTSSSAGLDALDANAGTSSLTNGKITIGVSLVP